MTNKFQSLKSKQREIRDGFPTELALRVHRAISWYGRAEKETEDFDAKFTFLWIAFNAAYAKDLDSEVRSADARSAFNDYFDLIVRFDCDQRILNELWLNFSGPVKGFIKNQYVFNPFWVYQNTGLQDDWELKHRKAQQSFARHFSEQNTAIVLSFLFDRLYVLRNQIIHGGATWNSSVNREQVRDGANILSVLMPIFIDIMMDNSAENWGEPFYPVV